MHTYLNLLKNVLENGVKREDRTNTGTISIFGTQTRYDLRNGFPLVTTKKCHLRSIIHELLWFIKGDTNIKYLQDNKVRIWNEWADENGDLGPVYGHQWRNWTSKTGERVDQLLNLVDQIKSNPYSRRHILTAWNPGDLDQMALPPCHAFVQFYVTTDNELCCQLYQRSADLFLGVPFNIASYALLTMMIAQVCELKVGEFVHTIGDAHIYLNHIEQVKLQLTRDPKKSPKMILNPDIDDILDFKYEDFTLEDYEYHPSIAGKVAV